MELRKRELVVPKSVQCPLCNKCPLRNGYSQKGIFWTKGDVILVSLYSLLNLINFFIFIDIMELRKRELAVPKCVPSATHLPSS